MAMAEFIDRHRPPEHLRQRVDLDWRLEGQSVVPHAALLSSNAFAAFTASRLIASESAMSSTVSPPRTRDRIPVVFSVG